MHPTTVIPRTYLGRTRIPRLRLSRLMRIWSDAPTTSVRAGGGGTRRRGKHRRGTGTKKPPTRRIRGGRFQVVMQARKAISLKGPTEVPAPADCFIYPSQWKRLSTNGEKNGCENGH